MSTMTAREFKRDVSAAKRAAAQGPVVITDRGEPAFALMAIKDYERLTDGRTIVDWLRMDAGVDFEPGRVESLPRAADL